MTSPTEPTEPDASDETIASLADPGGGPETLIDAPAAELVADDPTRLTPTPVIDVPEGVLTVVVTLVFLMFLLIEPTPTWAALFGAAVAAVGTDRVLRLARTPSVELGIDPTLQVALPALYTLAAPVLLEDMVRGWWALPAGLAAGIGFGVVLVAQVHSVRPYERWLAFARPATSAAVYVTAFALFSLTYVFDLALAPALAAVAIAAGLLAIELLRDGRADPSDTIALAGVVALVVTQLRWTLHFVPLEGYLAALALLLGFFLASGLLHAHLTLELRRAVVAQYAAIAAVGGVLIIGARSAGLA